MKKAALFCLGFILPCMIYAQHIGYVITTKNDTINCNMVKLVSFGGIQYQVMDGGDFIKVKGDHIREYQLTDDSAVYVNKILSDKNQPYFLQREIFGKISLFSLFIKNNYQGLTYYVAKETDTAFVLSKPTQIVTGNTYKKGSKEILVSMFADKPAIAIDFKAKKRFDLDEIIGYIRVYNAAATASIK